MVLSLHRPSELSDHNRKAPIVVLTNHRVKPLLQLVGNNGPLNRHEVSVVLPQKGQRSPSEEVRIVVQMRHLFGPVLVLLVLLMSLFCAPHKDIAEA